MTTKITASPYDYHDLLQRVSKTGKDLFGRDFVIEDVDKPVVTRLLCYFLKDEAIAAAEGISLRKGVLLMGPVGCGKTALMKIMSNYCSSAERPVFRACNEVVFDFNNKGYESLNQYTKNSFFSYSSVPRVYCFDDLGAEAMGYHFGSSSNVLTEILLSRYNHFVSRGMLTHLTTSMTSTELEGIYGKSICSRIREMFNQIKFNNASRDKRQ
ncbi:AAA family ATPase [Chitinophaga sp.]|uniref:AAA family ATPase n=1 Tax=Chitinophaga sp. TaxID=1869181 RepID=UPI0031D3CD0B